MRSCAEFLLTVFFMELLAGTYTRGTGSEGIYRLAFDASTGTLSPPELLAACENPSWVVRWPGGLLAVNEHGDADGSGEISVFRTTNGGCALEQRIPSGGADPCHLAITGNRLAVANYTGGTVALFEWQDGVIGSRISCFRPERVGPSRRQASPHPHGVYFAGEVLLVPDLGGDCIYRLSARDGGLLGRIDLQPGAGPRHLSPGADFVLNELDNTVTPILDGDAAASISTLPSDFAGGSSTAEIQRLGDRLYVSNRGHDSIAVLATKPELELIQVLPCGGRQPRHFLIAPDGHYLLVANRDTDNIVCMAIDGDGLPGAVVSEVACPAPVHLLV